MTAKQVFEALRELAPMELAESWDNPGLLVECAGEVTGVLATLDITPAVIAEAKEKGCNLIVSHHPVIFSPLKALKASDPAALLVAGGISAVCMHTNLDAAKGGVNDTLAAMLGLENVEAFAGLGRVGDIAPVNLVALAGQCKQLLHNGVKYSGRPEMLVERVAIVTGAGGSMWEDALATGAQVLVTGEVSHHAALDAAGVGLATIAAGHFATERPVVPVVAEWLRQRCPALTVVVSERDHAPFTYL